MARLLADVAGRKIAAGRAARVRLLQKLVCRSRQNKMWALPIPGRGLNPLHPPLPGNPSFVNGGLTEEEAGVAIAGIQVS